MTETLEATTEYKKQFASDKHPFDEIEWELRTAEITDSLGTVIFRQENVEVPRFWSMLATKVVVSKYFYGEVGTDNRETSVKQLISRVADTITHFASHDGHFNDEDGELDTASAENYRMDLTWLLVNQYGAFNSPVWFNVGLHGRYGAGDNSAQGNWYFNRDTGEAERAKTQYEYPQGSACFIQPVKDDMESIMDLACKEAMLFKFGSGTGTDLSTIRSSREKLSGGGTPSGPLSFLKIYDQVANVVKSGGKTRRAAKMNTLNTWHGDIEEFIECKEIEEKKAHALIDQGYDGNFNGPAYGSIAYQNENLSVRADDRFMKIASGELDEEYWTRAVTTGAKLEKKDPSKLLDKIASGTWFCGDPGMQYDTTIQNWHTCAGTSHIHSTNPCCFTGETLVDTSEGRIRFDELERMDREDECLPLAFSFDFKAKMPVLRQIKKVWKSGDTTSLVRVTTDKGIVTESTPDHVYYAYDGSEIAAQDLIPGTRLRKIAKSWNKQRGRRVIRHRETSKVPNGEQWLNRFIWEEANGPIPEGYDVHHTDGNKENDRLSNYSLEERVDHKNHHAQGSSNNRWIEVPESLLLEVWDALSGEMWKLSGSLKEVTPTRWNAYVQKKGLKGRVPLAQSPSTGGHIQGLSWNDFSEKMKKVAGAANDRVQSVEIIELQTPVAVYDMEVDGVHNFSVSSPGNVHSIVVHNSEYVFLDNTACNLASLNLMKFRTEFGTFDFKKFKMAVRVFIRAQEAIVDNASYPSKEIAENSHIFRTLGLGYANLGALIMSYGLPYDSFEARCLTGSITSLMTGEAYAESARMAEKLGAFPGYHDARCNGVPNPIDETNVNSMSRVIERHNTEASKLVLKTDECELGFIREIAREGLISWGDALLYGSTAGYRNAQVTVVAPTGTIAFLMDCDTTGIEPDIALVKYKVLAGGGMLKIVNNGVKFALKQLGYKDSAITRIVAHIDKYDTIEDIENEAISGLKPEHLPVFDCAFQASKGKRSIHYKAHLEAMAAAQPFISGAISKTVNMPKNSTVEDIRQAYIDAWKMGLKCVAIYRDGSKRSQPLNTSNEESSDKTDLSFEIEELRSKLAAKEAAPRKRLPDTRSAVNHKFDVAGHEGYLTVGLFEDGTPGELFITMAKEGSTVGGLMDTIGTLTSMALQYGVPLDALVRKFSYQRFEPSGFTKNPNIRQAASIIDYVFRWISQTFSEDSLPEPVVEDAPTPDTRGGATSYRDGQTCGSCGSSNVQVTGSCATCLNCGTSLGCS